MSCATAVITLGLFLFAGLLVGGIILLSIAGRDSWDFTSMFHDYKVSKCTVIDFKVVVDTTYSVRENCGEDDVGCRTIEFFIGVAAVRVEGGGQSAFAAVVQHELRDRISVSVDDIETATDMTFGPEGAFPVEIGDSVECGVPPTGLPALFGDVKKVPYRGVVALAFNKEIAESEWLRHENFFIAGGCMTAIGAVIAVCWSLGVFFFCREM
jgi:hypothetical protein